MRVRVSVCLYVCDRMHMQEGEEMRMMCSHRGPQLACMNHSFIEDTIDACPHNTGYVHQVIYNCNLAILVGPKGQTIKSIQGDTQAKIYTPKSGSPNQHVVIVGAKANVARALKQVQRVLGTDLKTLTTKSAPPPVDDDFFMEESYE